VSATRLKPQFRVLVYGLLPIASLVLLGASHTYQQQKRCTGVQVNLAPDTPSTFVSEADIRRYVGADVQLVDAPLSQIQLQGLEQSLLETDYIEHVAASWNNHGRLELDIQLREPIARFEPNHGRGFYLDKRLQVMPLSRRKAAHVVLVRGHCTFVPPRPYQYFPLPKRELKPLLEYLDDHPVWKAQIAEIYVQPDGQLVFYPEFGDTKIRFGYPTDLAAKFEKLERAYGLLLPTGQLPRYKALDLRFEDQVVGVRTG